MVQTVTRLPLTVNPALLLLDGKVPPGHFPLDQFV